MKIKVLSHDLQTHLPSTSGNPAPLFRNLDPLMHPHARARERKRALNASKLERMFAKPFVAAFEGHEDSVTTLERIPGVLASIVSGSYDGGIIFHQLAQQRLLAKIPNAHKGKVSGICIASDATRLLSCGHDRNVKMWNATSVASASATEGNNEEEAIRQPLHVYPGKTPINAISHHRSSLLFATASNSVHLWDETKSVPLSDLTFGGNTSETVECLKFNMAETSVLASAGSDRTLVLYDVRTGKAERKIVMRMRSNAISWSPTYPTSILLASEDHNLYTFDVRSLTTPTQIYKGHVSAVMSCDISPTGQEIVSGGWDRTVRIWKEGQGGGGTEVYHTKRMQRVLSVLWTSDARFVLSGSEDGIVRLWKGDPSERLGVRDTRERNAMEYRNKLKERWKFDNEIAKIQRSRRIPKPIKNAAKLKRTMHDAQAVKEDRRRKHSRAGETKPKAEKKKVVVVEQP